MNCASHYLHEKPTLFDFFQEKLITAVPFFTALYGLFKFADSLLWPFLYLGIIGGHITHIILKRCPHCAYYKKDDKMLSCLWFRWIPKIRKQKSGPVPGYIGIYTPIALFIITVFPLYWLTMRWELLVIYTLSWTVLFLSISSSACSRCIDFNCKFNSVPELIRKEWSENNKNIIS